MHSADDAWARPGDLLDDSCGQFRARSDRQLVEAFARVAIPVNHAIFRQDEYPISVAPAISQLLRDAMLSGSQVILSGSMPS